MGSGRNERGLAALSSPVALLSLGAVVLAGVAYVTTGGEQPTGTARPVTAASSPAASSPAASSPTASSSPAASSPTASASPSDSSSSPASSPGGPSSGSSGTAPKGDQSPRTGDSQPKETATSSATADPKQKQKRKAIRTPVRRSGVYVEVYNNSGISGLAGSTASTLAGAGWEVVGSDNWYGTIPASTVYYPERLEDQARLLAKDVGVARVMPAIPPMRFDRLTVILTADVT